VVAARGGERWVKMSPQWEKLCIRSSIFPVTW
jgi:hypothetical protein